MKFDLKKWAMLGGFYYLLLGAILFGLLYLGLGALTGDFSIFGISAAFSITGIIVSVIYGAIILVVMGWIYVMVLSKYIGKFPAYLQLAVLSSLASISISLIFAGSLGLLGIAAIFLIQLAGAFVFVKIAKILKFSLPFAGS